MKRILIADDDPAILELLTETFRQAAFEVKEATDGDEALELARTLVFDGLLLDLMMPQLSGIDVTRKLRKAGNRLPIVILTARDDEEMRQTGLERGVDLYLDKTTTMVELVKQVTELLDRPRQAPNGLTLDVNKKAVKLDGRTIDLTKREFEILEYLSSRAETVVTRDDLLQKFWGTTEFETYTRTMDVLISRLRKKLDGRYIETRRGFGYVFTNEKKG